MGNSGEDSHDKTQENLALGKGEDVKFLNNHFSAENIERNIEEFGWGAAEGARMQIPQGTGASPV